MRAALALIFLLCTAAATAQPVTMWQVDGEQNSVYLLGSVHLLRKDDHPLPEVFERAYQDAEVIVMEIDMDDIDPVAMQAAFVSHGLLGDGATLAGLLGEDAYARAAAGAETLDIPLHLMTLVEPWYAAMTIEIMLLDRLGFRVDLGVEAWAADKAMADGKPIVGLETAAEQIGFLDGLSLESQREMLLATLEDGANLGATMEELVDAWQRGDIAALDRDLPEIIARTDELYDAILVDRNKRWIGQIVDLLDDRDDYLVIVGAAHLVGDDGVPRLLERHGFEARQLSREATLR